MSDYSKQDDLVAFVFRDAVADTGRARAICPMCEEVTGKADKRWSMYLDTETGFYRCYKCGVTGRLDEFGDLAWTAPLPGEVHSEDAAPEPETGVDPPEGFVALGEWPGSDSFECMPAHAYLDKRGVAWSTIRATGLGVCFSGRCRSRIVVPHRLPGRERWEGWVARDYIGDMTLKYLYPPGMSRSHLWNEGELAVPTSAPVLLVEGVFDALPHYPHAAAFLGKPTREHVATLEAHRGRPLAMCLDADATDEGWALAMKLRFQGVPVGFVKLPPGTDPGTLETDWLLAEARRSLV